MHNLGVVIDKSTGNLVYFNYLTRVDTFVIDLRNNTGGNCWPMLAGLGPLLGNGVHGYFVSPKETIPIGYKDGASMQGKYARCIANNPYTLASDKKTIIVLTGNKTSSAGEIVALSFKGLPNVYLYGEPTAGLTTANFVTVKPAGAIGACPSFQPITLLKFTADGVA